MKRRASMKKRNIAIFLIISILVILGIVKKIQNIYEFPYLYVISDKKWKAYAYPAYEGGQWTGEMFFLGNKEGDVGKIQYSVKYNGKENYYNGEIKPTKYDIHNTETDEKIIKEKRNKVYELWEFAEFDENENNKIEIRVNWKESNKQHSQVLKLKMYYGRTNYILRRVKRFLL